MKGLLGRVAVAMFLGSGISAPAAERPGNGTADRGSVGCPSPLLFCCPDDYCPKPLPPVTCPPCGRCNDYCKKPLPQVCRLPCGKPDNYCRKPWPDLGRSLRCEHSHRGPCPTAWTSER
jgi:hypothetical protein